MTRGAAVAAGQQRGSVRGRGRGGGRGGKGAGRGGKQDPKEKLLQSEHPSYLHPAYFHTTIPKTAPPTPHERRALRHLLRFRTATRQSPLYTNLRHDEDSKRSIAHSGVRDVGHMSAGSGGRLDPSSVRGGATFNPFEHGMESREARYRRPERKVPGLMVGGRKYAAHLFPTDLHDVLQVKRKSKRQANHRLLGTAADAFDENSDDADDDDMNADLEAELNEDFEDADSDMGGDYNAEMYFDDGADGADVGFGDGGGGMEEDYGEL
ncbi:MAG: hypothetical protein M1831_004976 [Alyxoria varia]|nr:MAG: hypothetical protein M1831_004976 [Alyxoria varia]